MNEIDKQLIDIGHEIDQYLSRNFLVGSDRDNMLVAIMNLLLTIVDVQQDDFSEAQQVIALTRLISIIETTRLHPVGERLLNSFCRLISQFCDIVSEPHWDNAWVELSVQHQCSYLSELYVGNNSTVKNCFVICA